MEWTGARYADTPTVEVAVHIDAPADAIWPLIADPVAMPDLSDELQSVAWLDGVTQPNVGARFVGHSAHTDLGEWETVSYVIEHEVGQAFAWAVSDPQDPSAIWRFQLTPDGQGTRLSQRVQLGPGRSGLSYAIDRMPEKEQKIVFVRLRDFETNMTRTLADIKRLAESGHAAAFHRRPADT